MDSIPRLPLEPWATYDVSDSAEIWEAANNVGNDCITSSKTFGWASVGNSHSLGVFVWAKGCVLERDAFRVSGPRNVTGDVTMPLQISNKIDSGLDGTATS